MPTSSIANLFGLDNDEVFYAIELFGGDFYLPLTYGHLDYIAVEITFWVVFIGLIIYLSTYNIFDPVEYTPKSDDDGITPYPGDMIV